MCPSGYNTSCILRIRTVRILLDNCGHRAACPYLLLRSRCACQSLWATIRCTQVLESRQQNPTGLPVGSVSRNSLSCDSVYSSLINIILQLFLLFYKLVFFLCTSFLFLYLLFYQISDTSYFCRRKRDPSKESLLMIRAL